METESRELAAVSRGKIRAGETDDWKSEQLFVPPLPPTNLRGCHMIRIQYDVFVSITISPPTLTQLIIVAAHSFKVLSIYSADILVLWQYYRFISVHRDPKQF